MKYLLLVLVVVNSLGSFGQNYLFETDSNGFSISGQLTSASGSTLIGVAPA